MHQSLCKLVPTVPSVTTSGLCLVHVTGAITGVVYYGNVLISAFGNEEYLTNKRSGSARSVNAMRSLIS